MILTELGLLEEGQSLKLKHDDNNLSHAGIGELPPFSW